MIAAGHGARNAGEHGGMTRNRGIGPAGSPVGSTVSVVVATAIVVADMVGVGVFTSLGFQVKDIPSGFAILLLWTVGGIVALCGVFSYSELGAMFPRSSGEYNFLSRAYHPAFGFRGGLGVGDGRLRGARGARRHGASANTAIRYCRARRRWRSRVGVVWLVSLVQLTGVRHSSTFQLISTILKVVLIIAFLIAGFVVGTPQPVSFAPHAADFGYVTSAPFAIGLVFVMYSFSGWNAATYIIGEMRDAAAEPAARAACGHADRARALCRAERGVSPHRADRQAGRPARRRPHRRQLYLRRDRRPHRRRDDLHRARILDQRDDVDRPARDDDDGRGHPGAAGIRPQIDPGRAGLCHPVSARGRDA